MSPSRRRFRLAAAGVAGALVVAALAARAGSDGHELVVRGAEGEEVARVDLGADGRFALGYRNSLYRVSAEERFAATDDGEFALVALASESLAVLEEYYGIEGGIVRASGAGGSEWRHDLAEPVRFRELRVVADELGRRAVVAGSRRLDLWRLVPDGGVVTLSVETQ